jgi:hypothetical protein
MSSLLGLGVLLAARVTGRVPVTFAIATITFLAFFWALFLRRPRRHHHKHHWCDAKDKEAASPDEKRRWLRMGRRHRRRRREVRANPTLAETGGLPAIRPNDPENPSDSI